MAGLSDSIYSIPSIMSLRVLSENRIILHGLKMEDQQ